jgi:hypothetical protein
MAPTEMVHHGPPLFQPESTTPPDSPRLLPVVTWSDDQATEMANAIAAMKITPTTLSSHFSSSETLLGNPPPSPEASVVEHLEQLISTIIEAKLSTSAGKSEDPKPVAPGDNKPEDVAAEASRLEFKTVDEMYVSSSVQALSQLTSHSHLVGTGRLIHMRLWNL